MNEITLVVKDGKPVTTSLAIAEHFGKLHYNVTRAIDNLECSEEFRRLNFEGTDYIDKNGDSQRAFELTRDGFAFLCMGFTGKKAAAWKERYILAFNAMEAQLQKKPANAALPYSVNPGDTLSKDQADELRDLVKLACLTLPKEQQAGFNIKVWSKLKSHFGVSYREIPASEFSEALAITARHIVECSALPALPAALTPEQIAQAATAALTEWNFWTHFSEKNGAMVPVLVPVSRDHFPVSNATLANHIASSIHCPAHFIPAIIQAAAGRLA